MIRKLIPFILVVGALGAGTGAGLFLRPTTAPEQDAEAMAEPAPEAADPDVLPEYVKLSNQFIVPVVEDGRITAMVILSLSLEVAPGTSDQVYQREPKLRDEFLQMLFDHANTGGFRGTFTDAANLVMLRTRLLEAGNKIVGDRLRSVLITDIIRQDN